MKHALLKSHSDAWLGSRSYRIAWLLLPLALGVLVYGSNFWITPHNHLRMATLPMSYTKAERDQIEAGLRTNALATIERLQSAADDDDHRALNYLGTVYSPGGTHVDGVTPNADTALAYYERAAALGNTNAIWNAGSLWSDSGNTDKACSYYERALQSDPGFTQAYADAAYCKATAPDVNATDKAKSIETMLASANAGNVRAYTLLGLIYLHQTQPDVPQAVKYFELAIAGNADDVGFTHNELGSIYFRGGKGVAQDIPKALTHFKQAYAKGSAKSALDLSYIYTKGTYGVPVDYKKAVEYAGFAAKQGVPGGHFNMYVYNLDGMGVPRNYAKAANHLLNAISLGDQSSLDRFKGTYASIPREFIRALQARMAKAVLYSGPISGDVNPLTQQSLNAILNSKYVFE